MPTLNEPLDYQTTRLFYDLFMKRFGEVWESSIGKCVLPIIWSSDCWEYRDAYLSISEDNQITIGEGTKNLPALTLGAFCEFVRKHCLDRLKEDYIYTYKDNLECHHICEIRGQQSVAFCFIANMYWHEPEKLYDEIAGFLRGGDNP